MVASISHNQEFGPFHIVRTLGRGGMGEVFVARTPWPQTPIAAVKRLRPDVARVPTFAERFEHEAQLAVRLAHPNVVSTIDVGSVEGQLYVASEFIMGKDTGLISDRLRLRGQGGPAAVAIRLLVDTLTGLAYVHGVQEKDGRPLRLIHRDVTPGNVLVSYEGTVLLADFGLAKSLLSEKSKLTKHGEIIGTPSYLAPEIIRGSEASSVSDLYGLGAVIYRFLTGIAPFQGSTAEVLMKVISEEPRPLNELRPDLPAWLVEIVHTMLSKEPAARPQDAQVLAVEVSQLAQEHSLLVGSSAVGRWLSNLFAEEYDIEKQERARLIAMPAESPEAPAEGTVVLARPLAGAQLEAPKSLQEADKEIVSRRLSTLDDDPGDVTEAAAVVLGPSQLTRLPEVAYDPNQEEEVPEGATAVDPSKQTPDQDTAGFQTSADAEAYRSDITQLPGFLEPKKGMPDRVDSSLGRPTAQDYDRESLLGDSEEPVPTAMLDVEDIKAEVGKQLKLSRLRDPADTDDFGPPRNTNQVSSGVLRSVAILGLLLVLAVVLGIGIGRLVAALKSPAPVVINASAPKEQHKQRLFQLKQRLSAAQAAGKPVPAELWRLISEAATALMAGDSSAAEKYLDQVETKINKL